MFRCFVKDRKYNMWNYEPHDETLDSPLNYKMFDGDVFFKNELNEIIVQQSPVKKCINIPGILLLENNRTYGRTENKKRLYYKCKPNDPSLPYFLIPYEIPMGFNKNFKNKYITFHYQHWNEKHPHGIISQNLGDVYDLPAFNEYQLYCKGLHSSISQAITKTKKKVSENDMEYYQNEIVMNPTRFGEISFSHNQDDIFVFSIEYFYLLFKGTGHASCRRNCQSIEKFQLTDPPFVISAHLTALHFGVSHEYHFLPLFLFKDNPFVFLSFPFQNNV